MEMSGDRGRECSYCSTEDMVGTSDSFCHGGLGNISKLYPCTGNLGYEIIADLKNPQILNLKHLSHQPGNFT